MKSQKNNYVYSLRINKEQMELLKRNKEIKEDLNKYVKEYLDSFLKDKNI